MKAFVTGGSGFIGGQVVRKLVARGYEVRALARSPRSQAIVEGLGATAVPGDITDVAAMRDAMTGCDVVFHIAAWYKIGADAVAAETINVGGTRKVLRLAHELGVPKIVYTSTVGVFGDTQGQMVDETYFYPGPFLTEYERTKWLAHYKVAVPLIEKGAPIIIVMPGAVYGPGDTSNVGEMMRWFYRGMPAVLGPETTLTFAHVEDIAEGHILAAEKGKIGESYILAGPAIPLGEMVDFWAHLTGKPAPRLRIPADWVRPFAPVMGFLNQALSLPPLFSAEQTAVLGATYAARADRARSQLGWQTRPLQTGMLETFNWIAETEALAHTGELLPARRRMAGWALGLAAFLLVLWLVNGRRRS